MSDTSGTLALRQVLGGMGAQLMFSLQAVRRLEAFCLDVCLAENVQKLQDFDKIAQVMAQLARCCDEVSCEGTVRDVQVQRSIVERLTLEEVRQRLLFESAQVSAAPGEVEFF